MISPSISLFLFFLSSPSEIDRGFIGRVADRTWVLKRSILCTYNFKQKYSDGIDPTTVGFFNSSAIYYCLLEEAPVDNISYNVQYVEQYGGDFVNFVYVEFPPPKRECMYGVTLLMNPLIKDEEECYNYQFDVFDDSKIHSVERRMCVFKYDNPFVENETVDGSTDLYEDKIGVWFRHIFSGCYALRFRINHKQRYIASNPIFLNTTYQRTEVSVPRLVCRYKAHPNPEEMRMTNFTLLISTSPDVGPFLQVALIIQQNEDKHCVWRGEGLLYTWEINLEVHSVRRELSDEHCVVKFVETVKGKYEKRIRCNFEIESIPAKTCVLYKLLDQRCEKDTIWKPPSLSDSIPCLWTMYCVKQRSWQNLIPMRHSDTLPNASPYLLLIIAIVLIVSAVIGILCFRRYLRIRREEINLYVNPQHDDSSFLKSTDSGVIDNIEKEIDHDNPSCDNIVLLYTNSSESFMASMEDFRKTLAKMCSCFVHDWHDGAVWNEVAKVGAVSWFTELLNNGCRVVWIDTPATRSTIISNTRDDESNTDKLSKYYRIHDFRDMAFRGVLEVAKSKINDVARQYSKHFIVRFEGIESTANVNDPFLDLSPHTRYYMPRHLVQLCSDLSVKPEISKCKTKVDKNVYRIFNFINFRRNNAEIYEDKLDDMK